MKKVKKTYNSLITWLHFGQLNSYFCFVSTGGWRENKFIAKSS